MGWREFRAWLREMNRVRAAESGRGSTDPDSWDGASSDSWWEEQRKKRAQLQGR